MKKLPPIYPFDVAIVRLGARVEMPGFRTKCASNGWPVVLLVCTLSGCGRSPADQTSSSPDAPKPLAVVSRGNDPHGSSKFALSVSPSKAEIENFIAGKSFRGPRFPDIETFEIDRTWSGSFAGIDLGVYTGNWFVQSEHGKNNAICVTIIERQINRHTDGPESGNPFCRTVNSLDEGRMSLVDPRTPEHPYDVHVRT